MMAEKSVYEVIQLDDRSWIIVDGIVRTFLFAGAKKALLVDTGFGTGDLKATVKALTDLPIMLVNTHADRDHVSGNVQFETAFIHPAEYDRYYQFVSSGCPASPLWEGDVIDLGGRNFEVILIPGHTPGSIALLDIQKRVLIAGDSIGDMIYMFGPGRHMDAYIASMEKLFSMQGRFDTVFPAHGNFPLSSSVLSEYISGACRIRNGEIPRSAPPIDVLAGLYDVGVTRFLFSQPRLHKNFLR
jgi:Zn-dependent hydrolases, including glyoxylases